MRFLLAWVILALSVSAANAQTTSRPCYAADGNGSQPCTYVSPTTPMPVTGSFSASIAGFPTTQTTGTPISVTTGGVSGTLPAGAVVVATNVGTTNAAYCKLGASATTSDQYIAPSGGWFAFTVGSATQLTCITSTSTTTVNMVGGSGLPTGTGGGGGGSGGAVTIASGGVASGAYASGSLAAGSMVDLLTMRAAIGGTTGSPADVLVQGCQYLASAPTYTTGDSGAVQCTINGYPIVNVSNTNANGQTTMSSSSPVALASNQSVADPCMFQAKTNLAFSSNPNNANVALVTGVSAKKIYVCSFSVIAAGASAVSLTEGSGATCGTSNQAAVIGVASNGTLSNGLSLAANGGLTLGNGTGTIAATATNADYLCIAGSGNFNLAGNITYVQQ